ncbi:Ger(x)C family spore germination protein [Paenibacillus graminis]|uniref:Ger(x)C family spore germination protein n=1 Tax=Paenibacillus graminis TaxID=189425 RepID=UPI002DBB01B6|nr:Ger(x)C family spore germination protein [Paenibacillus graminis]MEC0170426.1 Ger(x)C family spore germination protein [Paenibacillus graminis]
MKTKRLSVLILFAVLSLNLAGCWNSRELNELAIVSGIGVDRVMDTGELRVTFQVVNPSATATTQGASTSQSPISIYSVNDRTVFGALRRASKQTTRQLFFAHAQLLVIGESLAESGMNDVLDIFERSHELRLNTTVLVSRGTDAESIMKVLLPQESVPSIGLGKKAENTSKVWGETPQVSVFETVKEITGGGGFTISGVRMRGNVEEGQKKASLEQTKAETSILISGQAVFKKGKLENWIDGPEARGTQWILDKIVETNMNIDSGDQAKAVAVNVVYSNTKIKVEMRDGLPVFQVYISEEGNLNETESAVDLSKNQEIKKLETEMEKLTKKEVREAFQAAQRLECDYFNFANEFKRVNPAEWKKVEKDWNQIFAKGTLDVQVQAYIRATGMRLTPLKAPE